MDLRGKSLKFIDAEIRKVEIRRLPPEQREAYEDYLRQAKRRGFCKESQEQFAWDALVAEFPSLRR